MSEPSSLYLRVTLSEAAFKAFRNSPAVLPRHYDDWLPWLATKSYYGSISEADIQAMAHPIDPTTGTPITVAEYLFPQGKIPWGQASRYDSSAQRWTFAMLECSENYKEFIEILSVLRGAAQYKDLPGQDAIVIFPYLWGGIPEAYLTLEQGRSQFETTVPHTVPQEADAMFKSMWPQDLDPNDL